jgi:hypothetical protein
MPRADYTRVTVGAVGAKSESEYTGRRGEEPAGDRPSPCLSVYILQPHSHKKKNPQQLKGTDCDNLEATKPLTLLMLNLIINTKIFYSCLSARERISPMLRQLFL